MIKLDKTEVVGWEAAIRGTRNPMNSMLRLSRAGSVHAKHRRMITDHKLDEWLNFCKWIETLPYSDLILANEIKETL